MYANVLDFAQMHSQHDINETDTQGNRDSQMITYTIKCVFTRKIRSNISVISI
jgi:hypothetical protein